MSIVVHDKVVNFMHPSGLSTSFSWPVDIRYVPEQYIIVVVFVCDIGGPLGEQQRSETSKSVDLDKECFR
uniref:Uncharacterized protein n=1 Tax=Romanomermis culicivorax TaxID=13658 RepID=A0A915L2E2_ROMCU